MKTDFTLFSELYSCYYQIVRQILYQASKTPLTGRQMEEIAGTYGYQESALSIIPNLIHGDWPLLEKVTSIPFPSPSRYRSRLSCSAGSFPAPLTALQKSWLKALISDPRLRLFLTDRQLSLLEDTLHDIPPLFCTEDFHLFDSYSDHDPFTSLQYRAHFMAILDAIEKKELLSISYLTGSRRILKETWLPCRFEYGEKEGKFRLFCIGKRKNGSPRLDVLNVARILKAEKTGRISSEEFSIDTFLDKALCPAPLILEITDQRNALERAMLHFSCFEKKIERLDSSGRYRCSIYYDKRWETELLIQVLSFGPVIKVIGPESFLRQVTERVANQPDRPI